MNDKVRCGFCYNEVNGKCSIKKSTVKLNKKRRCGDFVMDDSRLVYKKKPVVRRGYDRSVFKANKAKEKKYSKLKREKERFKEHMYDSNITDKYPSGIDLNRFLKTTASEED